MDLISMREACAATAPIVDGLRPDQLGEPTPCTEWNVRAVLNHLLGTLSLGAALLTDTPPTVVTGAGGQPVEDLLGADPATTYAAGVRELLAAADGDALLREHTTPFGPMPGAAIAGFTTLDIAVHGWDLAVATGQKPALGDELAERLLGYAQRTLVGDMRSGRIGPQVAVPADAPVTDRLVGFLGRTP
jgi:uncharacterized protein (TIGR03086 family)